MFSVNENRQRSHLIKNLREVYALDLGTTKFCLAHIEESNAHHGAIDLPMASLPAEGMHRGMLSDKDKAIQCLSKLIEVYESKHTLDINGVVVGVAGSHLKGKTVTARLGLAKKVVSSRDIRDLSTQVEFEFNSPKREILHIIPITYQVDSRIHIENPLGLNGDLLVGDFFIIDAEKSYLLDIIDVCNQSGLHVSRLYAEPFASSSVTISDEMKRLGCSVLDVGGGTSDGIVYINGRPVSIYTINIAGKMMTNDLSIGLGVTYKDAESIKLNLGANNSYFPLEITTMFGKQKTISRNDALMILTPRLQELAHLVAKELSPFKSYLKGGLILTGGASDVTGILEMFALILGLTVTKVNPELRIPMQIDQTKEAHCFRYSGPMATTLGLLNIEMNRLDQQANHKSSGWSHKYIGPLLNWLKELY